jgi:hypothetical protein
MLVRSPRPILYLPNERCELGWPIHTLQTAQLSTVRWPLLAAKSWAQTLAVGGISAVISKSLKFPEPKARTTTIEYRKTAMKSVSPKGGK